MGLPILSLNTKNITMEKIIHQIWIGDFKMPLREQALTQKIKLLHPDYEYKLWTDLDIKEELLPENMNEVYHEFYEQKQYVFCADLLRIYLVYKYGGFYLDVDFDVKQPLDKFFVDNKGYLFHHNDEDFTIPNNLICMEKESPILKYCIEKMNRYCKWYGPSWLGTVVKEFLHLPYETPHNDVKLALEAYNVTFYPYNTFENKYASHLSLYSWEHKTWEKLKNGEQL
jgi:mannosyltransferase OCH1-like enzyme